MFSFTQITITPVTCVISNTAFPTKDVAPPFYQENALGKIANPQSTQKTRHELAQSLVQRAKAYEERVQSIRELSHEYFEGVKKWSAFRSEALGLEEKAKTLRTEGKIDKIYQQTKETRQDKENIFGEKIDN